MPHYLQTPAARLARFSGLLLVAAAVLISGCARAPRAGTPLKPVEEGNGDVYLYRKKTNIAQSQPFYTTIDGKVMQSFTDGTYLVFHLPPGKHYITVSPGPIGFNRGRTIQVTAGERRYYQFDFIADLQDKSHLAMTAIVSRSAAVGAASVNQLSGVAARLNDSRSSFRRSNYAALGDAASLPGVDERGRAAYRNWLKQKLPRAFVVASDGRSIATWGTSVIDMPGVTDPATRAMRRCATWRNVICQVYAVNTSVVWTPFPAALMAADKARRQGIQNEPEMPTAAENGSKVADDQDESGVQSTTQPVMLPSIEPIIID